MPISHRVGCKSNDKWNDGRTLRCVQLRNYLFIKHFGSLRSSDVFFCFGNFFFLFSFGRLSLANDDDVFAWLSQCLSYENLPNDWWFKCLSLFDLSEGIPKRFLSFYLASTWAEPGESDSTSTVIKVWMWEGFETMFRRFNWVLRFFLTFIVNSTSFALVVASLLIF